MNKTRRVALVLVCGLSLGMLSACSDSDDDESTTTTAAASGTTATSADSSTRATAPASGATLTISGFKFSPNTLTAKVGDVISVTNKDSTAHTFTAKDGTFDTGLIQQNETKTVTVTKAGTFDFKCTPHPNMTGTLTVS